MAARKNKAEGVREAREERPFDSFTTEKGLSTRRKFYATNRPILIYRDIPSGIYHCTGRS